MMKTIRVALAGNPNAGKTSLFNAITGAHHKVGNYPGVTVEKREGLHEYKNVQFRFIDLPGIYSLTAYSLDEVVARDFLLEEKPDIVIDVLDSTNLERNLYLCLQFQELGIPVVGALNMTDEAEAKGLRIDAGILSETLGIPLVKTVGTSGRGIEGLLDAALEAFETATTSPARRQDKFPSYGDEIESRLGPLRKAIASDTAFAARYPVRWLAIKLLENDANALKRLEQHERGAEIGEKAAADRAWLSKHYGKDSEIVVTEQRYGYIRGALREAVKKVPVHAIPVTEIIDKFLMSPVVGLPIFFLMIWGIFKLTFALGEYPTALLEQFFALLAAAAKAVIPPGYFQSLVLDGIIHGVGGVFSFVPLIVILFLCISILEDTGYMSRAAFLTDKALHAFGLHGQSFMPMMLGFGCTVPAIMATRTLKSPRDRIATILAVPFMSCGAKLPVYVLLAGTFFPKNADNVVMGVYLTGVVLSMLSTIFLRKTVLKGQTTPFVMELPPYRLPTWRGIFWHVWGKTLNYIKKAGTVILAASVLIWVITTFPLPKDEIQKAETIRQELATSMAGAEEAAVQKAVDSRLDEYRLEYSVAGRIGKFMEPAIRPLGFNWKIGVALIPGFSAKELVVSTLGILYGAQTSDANETESLRNALRSDPGMNQLTAIVLMMFILIMPPCFASLATIKAEAGNKWLIFQVIYSFTLAWLVSFVVKVAGGFLMGA
ncbi:MAG TPA: ferrous iron transport protein B [Rectinemataceae bacterium]|nr:ferrous iron transport protein B [Rectinemataceae bacterium]